MDHDYDLLNVIPSLPRMLLHTALLDCAGIRKESEAISGVSDFLLMASLAGGTGSGTGSAILEYLADEYPASTVAAVAVAPGHTGVMNNNNNSDRR